MQNKLSQAMFHFKISGKFAPQEYNSLQGATITVRLYPIQTAKAVEKGRVQVKQSDYYTCDKKW